MFTLKRSAMRAVAALLVIQDSDKNPQLNEFVLHIRSSPDLQVIINAPKHQFPLWLIFLFLHRLCSILSKRIALDTMEIWAVLPAIRTWI